MVQTALRVLRHGQAGRLQGCHHLGGHFGAAGGGVLHLVQAWVKAAKVMDGFGPGGKTDGGHSGVPVRADHHDGAGLAQLSRHLFHGRTRGTGVQGKHGGAVGHKQDGASAGWGVFRGHVWHCAGLEVRPWEKPDAIQVGLSGFAVAETAAVTVLTAAPAFQATIPPSLFTPIERLFFSTGKRHDLPQHPTLHQRPMV